MAKFGAPPSKVAEKVAKALRVDQDFVTRMENSTNPDIVAAVTRARGRAEAFAAVNEAMNEGRIVLLGIFAEDDDSARK